MLFIEKANLVHSIGCLCAYAYALINMALIIIIKMMTRGLFLRMMGTYHDGVDNVEDIEY